MTTVSAAQTSQATAAGFQAQLDDMLLRLAVGPGRELRIETAQAQADRVNTAVVPEEMLSAHGEVYARADFTSGEGLDRAHQRNQAPGDASRYWDSRGIRIERPRPGRRREMSLLEDTEVLRSVTASRPIVLSADGLLVLADGGDVYTTDDPYADPVSWDTEDPGTDVTVVDLAVLGDEVYAALGTDGISARASDGTWSSFSNIEAVRLWGAKARLVASDGTDLYEISVAETDPTEPIATLPSGQEWVGVADTPAALLAAASNGYVYSFTVNDSAELALDGQTPFEGEIPTALGSTQGLAFVATRRDGTGRLWVAEVDASTGALGGAQLVREWTDGWPRDFTVDGDVVYTAVVSGSETHAWRYDVVTGGLVRWHVYDSAGPAVSITTVDGSPIVACDADAAYRISDDLMAEGWLITPLADFFTSERKVWIGARLETSQIGDGATVELHRSAEPQALLDPDHSSWVRAVTATETTETSREEPMSATGRWMTGKVTLTADDDLDTSPTVRAIGFRALLAATDVIVEMPVNVSDVIEVPGMRPLRVPGLGRRVYEDVKARESEPVLLRIPRRGEVIRGTVEGVSTPTQGFTRRGTPLLWSTVTVRGRRASLGTSTAGAEVFGVALFGTAIPGGSA